MRRAKMMKEQLGPKVMTRAAPQPTYPIAIQITGSYRYQSPAFYGQMDVWGTARNATARTIESADIFVDMCKREYGTETPHVIVGTSGRVSGFTKGGPVTRWRVRRSWRVSIFTGLWQPGEVRHWWAHGERPSATLPKCRIAKVVYRKVGSRPRALVRPPLPPPTRKAVPEDIEDVSQQLHDFLAHDLKYYERDVPKRQVALHRQIANDFRAMVTEHIQHKDWSVRSLADAVCRFNFRDAAFRDSSQLYLARYLYRAAEALAARDETAIDEAATPP